MIVQWLMQTWVQKLGWTLLHFLWQGSAIAVLYAIVGRLAARRLSPQGRYVLACATLSAMTAAPLVTLLVLSNEAAAQLGTPHTAWWNISAAASPRLLPAIVLLWFAGVLLFSIRLFAGLRLTRRLRSTAHPAPEEWQRVLERFSLTQTTVRLMVSSLVGVPGVIGWLKPVILLPVELLTGMPAGYVTALLAHELAHVRRRDYLVNVLQSVAEAVLFYHPAVWWISKQIRAARELCCDDLAVAASGDVANYVRALAELESRQVGRLRPSLAADGGSLVRRIQRLLEPAGSSADTLPGPTAAWAMILLWISGLGVAAMHAAPAQTDSRAAANRAPARTIPAPAMQSPRPSPFAELANHARNKLLSDPIVSAQLSAPQSPPDDAPALRNNLETPWLKWLNEDVTYIITDTERQAFKQLTTDEERREFVQQFWLRRDPTPATVQNEFKDEYYRRIAYANEHFSSDVPGWKTDRGRIYIRFGPPDEIDSFPSPSPAREVWGYRFIADHSNVRIEFVDGAMTSGIPQPDLAAAPTDGTAMERLRLFAQLRRPPADPFANLRDAMGKPGSGLPMQVRLDYLRATDATAMMNVTVQCATRDLKFQSDGNKIWATLEILGRVSTMDRRLVMAFENPLSLSATGSSVEPHMTYQKQVPLAPGPYLLDLVAKDTVGGAVGSYETAVEVPQFNQAVLSSSNLILADAIERLPAKKIGSGNMFVIGDMKVRPRLTNSFTTDETIGIYLQVYNFMPDPATRKPSGSVEYRIEKDGMTDVDFAEDIGNIANTSASQVTVEKWFPSRDLEPGRYTLHLTVTDTNRNQTIEKSASFTVAPR